MNEVVEQVVRLNPNEILAFCGQNDYRIREIESIVDARIVVRGNEIRLVGEAAPVNEAEDLIRDLLEVQRRSGTPVTREQFRSVVRTFRLESNGNGGEKSESAPLAGEGHSRGGEDIEGREKKPRFSDLFSDSIPVPLKRRRLTPLTLGQKRYVDAIRRNDLVFGIGPAGTGKTYLAMAMAVASLTAGAVSRIILVRPAVEAGERLGFLPGDIAQKFDPYVRPLYDALYEMMDADQIQHAMETGVIEIAPLAFMRGRTLNRSFVILDEAQNTTAEQMKMFLTRMGFDSKAVVTGDITQIDLPRGSRSGLVHVQGVLTSIPGIEFVNFEEADVVRHDLVQKIIHAYEAATRRESASEVHAPPRYNSSPTATGS